MRKYSPLNRERQWLYLYYSYGEMYESLFFLHIVKYIFGSELSLTRKIFSPAANGKITFFAKNLFNLTHKHITDYQSMARRWPRKSESTRNIKIASCQDINYLPVKQFKTERPHWNRTIRRTKHGTNKWDALRSLKHHHNHFSRTTTSRTTTKVADMQRNTSEHPTKCY